MQRLAVVTTLLWLGTALAAGGTTAPSPQEPGQQALSFYRSLAADREVNERTVLLSAPLVLERPDWVFVQTDGTFAPLEQDSAARVFAEVDGARVTNESTIDWRGSSVPLRHSFNAVGATRPAAGAHTIELVAEPFAGSFTVSASSNLSVFVHPAERTAVRRLASDAGPFDYQTAGLTGPDLPHKRLAAVAANLTLPTLALAAGTSRKDARDGDAMLGIYVDRRHPGPASSLWTVNDTCSCAEVQGPLFTQALLSGESSRSRISVDATEFPWMEGEDPAIYVVPPTATLVVLNGGMEVMGSGRSLLPGFPDLMGTAWDFSCIGTSSDWPGCPDVGTDVLLAKAAFQIPVGHPGVVMLEAKTRVQADAADQGGTTRLWLTVDGLREGSEGVQELTAPFSVSQRTLSASYLAARSKALRPGRHVVRVFGRAEGSFVHVTFSRDLPLVWFD